MCARAQWQESYGHRWNIKMLSAAIAAATTGTAVRVQSPCQLPAGSATGALEAAEDSDARPQQRRVGTEELIRAVTHPRVVDVIVAQLVRDLAGPKGPARRRVSGGTEPSISGSSGAAVATDTLSLLGKRKDPNDVIM